MSKIQLESGPASSATHRLTQPSSTLNRRYVTRPTNLAIEEAAKSVPESASDTSAPSRLVNLRVHSADLLAATEAATKTPQIEEPIIRNVVELGGAPSPAADFAQGSSNQPSTSPEPAMSQTYTAPTTLVETTTYAEPAPINEPVAVVETVTAYVEPVANATSYAPAIVTASAPMQAVDPRDLAMSIAADYAAASMSAAVAEPTPVTTTVDTYVGLDATSTDSIDAIAQAASDAIASIRTATEPEEISEQIASLQAFAENIRANSSMPEMTELSNTIDKFISVAMKSTKVKETANKKVSLSSKANRAADKVAKSSAKVINRAKPTATAAKPVSKVAARKPVARPVASRPAVKAAAKRPVARPVSRAARPSAASLDQDQALRRALRSVAAMDDEPEARVAKSPVRRKGNVRRFALAFVCAVICVGAVTYFVGTNIPDISVRVAAMQTGVEASYPSYIPRDYSLKDISSESGKIVITFEGPERSSFTLTEEKSSWDSTTLLRNYVEPTWKDNYTSTHEQGITIYVSGSNAAWVNGGVLYKINSTGANLTNKQLRNIVTSM